MAKVIVGMSGGVDSAVAAYLLKIAGYEVVGLTLRTWLSADGKESRCCEIEAAQRVASVLNIPYYVVNCVSDFEKNVTEPFIDDYLNGRTPNPCTRCNRYVKWDKMLDSAKVMQADHIATGHYANVVRLDNGRYTFQKAVHLKKDQTYMLYALSQEQIAATLMPLGKLTKEEVRDIARKAGIPVADKPDSQEICFVNEGISYAEYIEEHAETGLKGPGKFVDTDGNVLGEHQGIIHYTVGQRKGLGLPLGVPAYVKEIRADENEVVIGREEDLYSKTILCDAVNLVSIDALNGKLSCTAKIRYQHAGQKAVIEMVGDDRVRLCFEEPVRAAAPGQAAVFYDDEDRLIGGGVIAGVSPEP
ncbi:MAG: tRNA 2-thiouridine(34) synthase MnmA [Lachnospiraceae bacterium]|nr:tRNA 2-thiouridine(34) synthase MnmA [Lachnospiraceae bacterium]